jgi:hypothetical protein
VLIVDHLKLAVSLYILHIPLTVYVVLPSVATISTNKIFSLDSTELYRWPWYEYEYATSLARLVGLLRVVNFSWPVSVHSRIYNSQDSLAYVTHSY